MNQNTTGICGDNKDGDTKPDPVLNKEENKESSNNESNAANTFEKHQVSESISKSDVESNEISNADIEGETSEPTKCDDS